MNKSDAIFPVSSINRPVQLIEPGIYSSFEILPVSSYDAKARAYEWLVRQTWYNRWMWGTLPTDYADFAREAVQGEPSEVLDIGCGGLSQTYRIYSKHNSPTVLLDYSLKMLQLGRKRIMNGFGHLPANLLFLQADAFHLPFKDDSFERVVSFGMIHLFNQKREYMNEALRVLKPGGSFHFSTLTTDRTVSKKYLCYLYKKNEVGMPVSSGEMLSMIHPLSTNLVHATKGSMLFLSGQKGGD